MMDWLRTNEEKMLLWANRRNSGSRRHAFIDRWLTAITHMGGATFTLATALLAALLAGGNWSTAGWKCFAAVVISHIPVAVVKRKFKRLRPYQALPDVNIGRNPLQDSSFPSGHTTAIFAWLVPWLLAGGSLIVILTPIALVIGISVAWSRMYLGLHYPSDVAAGAVLGTVTALIIHLLWSSPPAA